MLPALNFTPIKNRFPNLTSRRHGNWRANGIMLIQIFHQPNHCERHRQQVHEEMPGDSDSDGEIFAAKTHTTKQRA
jgi:hypothetical protein